MEILELKGQLITLSVSILLYLFPWEQIVLRGAIGAQQRVECHVLPALTIHPF